MNKEEFIQKIKDIKVNVPDEEFFLEYNKTIYDILDSKENLIKYIEDKIEELQKIKKEWTHPIPINNSELLIEHYTDLLERIKNNDWN